MNGWRSVLSLTEPVTFGGGQFFEKYLNDTDSKVIQLYNNSTTITTAQDLYDSQTLAVYTVPAGRVLRLLYFSLTKASTARYLRASDNTCTMWIGIPDLPNALYIPIYLEFAAGVAVEWRNYTADYACHCLGVETTT